MVGLYEEPERPAHAMDYVRRYLGAPTAVDVEGLKRENEDLKRQVEKLKKQLANSAAAAADNNNKKQQQQQAVEG